MNSEELKAFCHPERYKLQTPFSEGDYTFATDGLMCVRVPRLEDVPERENAPMNMLKNVFDPNPSQGAFVPLGLYEIPGLKGNQRCEVCGGQGQHLCNKCETLHNCGKCDGQGEVGESPIAVTIGRHRVSHLLLNRIKALPAVWIAENANSDEQGLTFRFHGGDGIVMPIRKEKE
jgi:hypothetical protein